MEIDFIYFICLYFISEFRNVSIDFQDMVSVIDCTELQVERSSCLQARKETYSNYKNRDTGTFRCTARFRETGNFNYELAMK